MLVAAVVAVGCGDDDAATDPDISDITSEPAEYVGENVDLRGTFDAWNADADSELDPDRITANAFRLWDRDADGRLCEEERCSSRRPSTPDRSSAGDRP